jgi:hypothetical protein
VRAADRQPGGGLEVTVEVPAGLIPDRYPWTRCR